jgi:hypothetical protein
MKEQISTLTTKQLQLSSQRDSLVRLVMIKTREYDTVSSEYKQLTDAFKTLEDKNKSLQSGYYSRGEQLKKANSEKEALNKTLDSQAAKNDSLAREINILLARIAAIDNQMAEAQKTNNTLAETVRQKEERIKADSIAEANRPKPVKEHGFVDIAEIGGGFGLGNVSVDYARSVISVDNIFAYQVNNKFLAGIGTGVNLYNGGTMIPLFIDMRYNFRGTKINPFIIADGGVLFNLNDFATTGIFINPALGVRKKLNEKISLQISTGVLLQEAPSGQRNTFINIKGGVGFGPKK